MSGFASGDGAELWEYRPVPKEGLEPAPEYTQEMWDFPKAHIIAARVRGKKHKHEGKNCDDWYAVESLEDAVIVAASDGDGARLLSHIGACFVCEEVVQAVKRELSPLLQDAAFRQSLAEQTAENVEQTEACSRLIRAVHEGVLQAREAVEIVWEQARMDDAYQKAVGREPVLADFSSTMLLLLTVPVARTGKSLFISCQIGDGAIVLLDTKADFGDSSVRLLRASANPEEEEFLVSEQMKNLEALQSHTGVFFGNADLALVMTNGLADDYVSREDCRRLYFDLLANGILGAEEIADPQEPALAEGLAAPVAHPWVNVPIIRIPLNYTDKLCEDGNLTPEKLWEHPEILRAAYEREELKSMQVLANNSVRLRTWLDNYVAENSADDRTLVIIERRG